MVRRFRCNSAREGQGCNPTRANAMSSRSRMASVIHRASSLRIATSQCCRSGLVLSQSRSLSVHVIGAGKSARECANCRRDFLAAEFDPARALGQRRALGHGVESGEQRGPLVEDLGHDMALVVDPPELEREKRPEGAVPGIIPDPGRLAATSPKSLRARSGANRNRPPKAVLNCRGAGSSAFLSAVGACSTAGIWSGRRHGSLETPSWATSAGLFARFRKSDA